MKDLAERAGARRAQREYFGTRGLRRLIGDGAIPSGLRAAWRGRSA